jgi:hypothetical protein
MWKKENHAVKGIIVGGIEMHLEVAIPAGVPVHIIKFSLII